MLRKIPHTVVLRPRITSDIEPREPEILGRRQGGTEPGRHANCLLTYYEPEMGFMRQPNGKSLDKDGPRPKDTHSTRHSSTPVA